MGLNLSSCFLGLCKRFKVRESQVEVATPQGSSVERSSGEKQEKMVEDEEEAKKSHRGAALVVSHFPVSSRPGLL